MLVHGGSFVLVGRQTMLTAEAAWWNARDYTTYDVDYRAGLDSLADVIAGYDWLHRAVGRKHPICVLGDSVGGTLALLLAVERPSVACVITEGAIFNELTMPPAFQDRIAKRAIPGHLAAWSPVKYAGQIRAPVLAAGSTADSNVSERQQLAEMKAVRPQIRTMLLAGARAANPWQINFTHASVTSHALAQFHAAEGRLLAQAMESRAAH